MQVLMKKHHQYVNSIRNILYTKSNMRPSNRHATVNVIPILNGIHYICRFNIVCGIIKIIIMRVYHRLCGFYLYVST